MRKAFIFSLDAFVSFTVVIVVLLSLVFIFYLTSSYYAGFSQAYYLAHDTLNALATADAGEIVGVNDLKGQSLLFYITSISSQDEQKNAIKQYIGSLIPVQYGYAVEYVDGNNKVLLYNTSDDGNDEHAKDFHKVRATASVIVVGYITEPSGGESPFCYITCHSHSSQCPSHCDSILSRYSLGSMSVGLVRLIVYR